MNRLLVPLQKLTAFCALLLLPLATLAQEVPDDDMRELLEQAQGMLSEGESASAIKLLEAWDDDDHALRHLLLGHAYKASDDFARAQKAYDKALQLNPTLKDATRGLADCAMHSQDWPRALSLFASIIDLQGSSADELNAYAYAAFHASDSRLATLIVEAALPRFPTHDGLRRLDLLLLQHHEKHQQAQSACFALLRETPQDTELWSALSLSADAQGDENRSLAALEARLLLKPDDLDTLRAHTAAQLSANHIDEAYTRSKRIRVIAKDLVPKNNELTVLCIVCAERAQAFNDAEKMLGEIPLAQRTSEINKLELHLLLKQNKQDEAKALLQELQNSGALHDAELQWLLGRLFERDDPATALAAYRSAHNQGHDLSTLSLGRLLHLEHRSIEALSLLREYLATHPSDEYARSLFKLIEEASKE